MNNIEEWLKRENKLLSSRRKYLHFDRRISPKKSISFITNPDSIISRPFWPFIHSEISFPRYKKDPDSNHRKIEIKKRNICYASHFDSQIYSYYNLIISKHYELLLINYGLTENVLAYRSINRKCNIHFAYEAFNTIQNYGEVAALTFDIDKFFDSLDHTILLNNWKKAIGKEILPEDQYKVFKSLTRFSTVDRSELNKIFKLGTGPRKSRICSSRDFRDRVRGAKLVKVNTNKFGIPQGSPLSGLLSNIYMIDFDQLVNKKLKSVNGFYRRYSDDLIVLCPIENIDEIKSFIINSIQNICKLVINQSKTDIIIFKKEPNGNQIALSMDGKPDYLQYLGFEFNGKNILIRSSSLSRYYRKMNQRIKKAVYQTKNSHSDRLNVFKSKLYKLYSHLGLRSKLGKRSFIMYAYRASEITKSLAIKRQLSGHWTKLNKRLSIIKRKKGL